MKEIKQKNEDQLLKKKNVNGVGEGYRNENGEEAIIIFVEKKEGLSALSDNDLIPEYIDGIKTDVVEIGEMEAFKRGIHYKKYRPVHGGTSAIWKKGTACTLGAVVYKDGKKYALMNTHCGMPHWKGAKVGDDIIQPSPNDFGSKSRDKIGKSTKYYEELLFDGKTKHLYDACLVELTAEGKELFQENIGAIKKSPRDPFVGMKVKKSGRTTGVTTGTIIAINTTSKVNYGQDEPAHFKGQFVVKGDNGTKFSQGGDSSSLVLTEQGNPVGILFAGNSRTGTATVSPIKTVMQGLDFSFSEFDNEEKYIFTKLLKKGSKGEEVKKLQEVLAADLGYFIVIDGIFGSVTEFYVKLYQKKYNLTQDGIVGLATRNKLNGAAPEISPYKHWSLKEAENMSHDLMLLLDELREKVGFALIKTSGYRTPEYNKQIGGATNSEHTKMPAEAMDIACTDSYKRFIIIKTALELGFKRIGIGETYIHLGISNTHPQNVVWQYYKSSNNAQELKIMNSHRIKSFLITAGSFIGTAIISVAITEPNAIQGIVDLFTNWVAGLGIPSAIVIFISLVINEIIRSLINRAKLNQVSAQSAEKQVIKLF